jgi:peroxiredoxin
MSEGRERGPLDFDDDPPAEHVPLRDPPQPPAPRERAQPMRYLWVVGAAAVVLVVVLGVATLRGGTERGARGLPAGSVMPPFAVPAAASKLDGDANIATKSGEGEAGHEPACTVRGPDVVNGCALREAGPVVLAFFSAKSEKCVAQLDAMQHVVGQAPGVQFAAIAIRGDRGDLRAMIRRHRWSFPVGFDNDGALTNAYHVQVCPQITFARRGGRVVDTTFGLLKPRELAAKVRSLPAS